MENQITRDSEFCRCGTPYFAVFVIGGSTIVNEVCPDCGRDVKPMTVAEFVKEAHEYEVLEPEVESEETKKQYEHFNKIKEN